MPKEMHRNLVKQANKLKLKGERRKAYIYGTMARAKSKGKK